MNKKEHQHLKELLKSKDIEFVKQGMELWEEQMPKDLAFEEKMPPIDDSSF